MNYKKLAFKSIFGLAFTALLFTGASAFGTSASANSKPVYDISQWQGRISNRQARGLHHEVSFMILKAENGGLYSDPQFGHNSKELQHNQVPYGVYDYALYKNGNQAREEGANLVRRAPQADFYVNDLETHRDKRSLDQDTKDWAKSVHSVTSKPAVLYSYEAFLNQLPASVKNAYNAIWIAGYGARPVANYPYDLWQYTNHHYSRALNKRIDASRLITRRHPLSFWTHGHNSQPADSISLGEPVAKRAKHFRTKHIRVRRRPRTVIRRHRIHRFHRTRHIRSARWLRARRNRHAARRLKLSRRIKASHLKTDRQRNGHMTWYRVNRPQGIKMYSKNKVIGTIMDHNLIPVDHFIRKGHHVIAVDYHYGNEVSFKVHKGSLVK